MMVSVLDLFSNTKQNKPQHNFLSIIILKSMNPQIVEVN